MSFMPIRVAVGQGLEFRLVGLGFLVREEFPSGTTGGPSVADADAIRDINRERVNTISGAFLGVNQFTLPAGTYDCWGQAVTQEVQLNRFVLYNFTDSADELIGQNAWDDPQGSFHSGSFSTVRGRFTIASPKVFEFRHYTERGGEADGLGQPASDGVKEIYALMHFLQVI